MATALKAVHVSDVPNLDQASEINAALALIKAPWSAQGVNDHDEGVETKCGFKWPKFVVMGHRGSGMNMLQSSDDRMKSIKENSILSFNSAAQLPIHYIEFDVQVTKDDCPVIFHDSFIATEEKGVFVEKRVTDITLPEFLSYGPQTELGKVGIPMFRKTKEGTIFEWKVEKDDSLCTLQDVFEKVDHSMGFNIELKFDDQFVYIEKQLRHVLQVVLQVTKDDCPVIFHDNFIVTHDKGVFIEKRVTDLKLPEFLSYGPQKHLGEMGMPLFRKMKDGRIFEWKVEKDAPLCRLQEAFENLEHSLGFNMELKFDDHIVYTERQLKHVLQVILQVINDYAKGRPIFFSTFQPDAALLIRKMQSSYPVYFLTEGGYHQMHVDARKNSLEAAVKVCLAGGLQGIVSEVSAILGNKEAVTGIQGNNLRLLTYGQLNNMVKAVCLQLQMGVDGVIVDLVQEITGAVCD